MSNLDTFKSNLAAAIRLFTAEGLMDANGHMSCRVPGTNHVLINPRPASRSSLSAQQIVTIDLDGKLLEGEYEPPSEYHIHTRIYCARPDVLSVAHLHPQYATVFSIAGQPLLPVFILGSIFPRTGIPLFDDPDLIRSRERGDAVAKALGAERAVMLRAHGAVTTGESIESCFVASIWLEENAKKQLWAAALGTPHVLAPDEVTRVRNSLWSPEVIRKTWDYYIAKGHASGVL
jgi:ribulose-5-phosphate 4-epimerase/fuculose-1-phosphate aldolase